MQGEEIALALLTLMVFSGMGLLWIAVTNRRALREMEHRERLAMIQRGLMPAPETDPLAFEQAAAANPRSLRSERWRAAGIMLVGIGLALMMLLTFTADSADVGIGVGGAFAVLGAALMMNGAQIAKNEELRARIAAMRPAGSPFPPSHPRSDVPPPREPM